MSERQCRVKKLYTRSSLRNIKDFSINTTSFSDFIVNSKEVSLFLADFSFKTV